MNEDSPGRWLAKTVLSFLEGTCRGGRVAQGANTALCSLILYAIVYWAFIGENSAWAQFKQMQYQLELIKEKAVYTADQTAQVGQHLARLDNQVTELGNHYQVLDTQVQVLDATTQKIGGKR